MNPHDALRTVRWHGRGGQGSYTAARLLGHALALHAGRHALAIPAFGPERRGAPVTCLTRHAGQPIHDRGPATTIQVAVVLDATMAATARTGLVNDGLLLVNSPVPLPGAATVDADFLALTHLGRVIPGSALLGALAALGEVPLSAVLAAVDETWNGRIAAGNRTLVQAGHDAVLRPATETAPIKAALRTTPTSVPFRSPHRPPIIPAPAGITPGAGPWMPAGHLVTGFSTWRHERALVDPDVCVSCGHCWLACPDGAIAPLGNAVAIDVDLCKGCGVCVESCAIGALALTPDEVVPHG